MLWGYLDSFTDSLFYYFFFSLAHQLKFAKLSSWHWAPVEVSYLPVCSQYTKRLRSWPLAPFNSPSPGITVRRAECPRRIVGKEGLLPWVPPSPFFVSSYLSAASASGWKGLRIDCTAPIWAELEKQNYLSGHHCRHMDKTPTTSALVFFLSTCPARMLARDSAAE